MVNATNADLKDSEIFPTAPFNMQIGSYALGPSIAGPRQTIQRDLFGRYDSSTVYKVNHTIRFGGAIHRIVRVISMRPEIMDRPSPVRMAST